MTVLFLVHQIKLSNQMNVVYSAIVNPDISFGIDLRIFASNNNNIYCQFRDFVAIIQLDDIFVATIWWQYCWVISL